ncbi:hypothetical protein KAU11_08620 [Candidatus Babeliales bacterium]|nr:hypothetical protein [Candidatus Babeliales bacterium]
MNSDTKRYKEIFLDYFRDMEDGDSYEVYVDISKMMADSRTDMFSFWLSDGLVEKISIEPSNHKLPSDDDSTIRSKFTFILTTKATALIKFDQL